MFIKSLKITVYLLNISHRTQYTELLCNNLKFTFRQAFLVIRFVTKCLLFLF